MTHPRPSNTTARMLVGLALASTTVYGIITWLSFRFQVHTLENNLPEQDRPLISVLALFGLAFLFYVAAVVIVRRSAATHATSAAQRRILQVIIGGTILFRAVMWFSTPIQEVDVYRYLWDGVVSSQGISPFRYPPEKIVLAMNSPSEDPNVERLAGLCRADPELAEVLRRVHFAKLPTVYPAVSQAVFAASAMATPRQAALVTRLRIMKLWLLAFDIGTLWMVIKLLTLCRLPPAMSVAYGWCPLVLKEIANSGHLDAIAVFLATLAVYILIKTFRRVEESGRPGRPWFSFGLIVAAVVLGLAVGAKLYPVVLVPLVAAFTTVRVGWRSVIVPAVVFACLSQALLSPMLPKGADPTTHDGSAGVMAFLRSWEMNDFLFMLVVENLKPTTENTGAVNTANVWFSVMPQGLRDAVINMTPYDTPFAATRFITVLIFVAVALFLASRACQCRSGTGFCEAAFLTIAWFWLLCPTQNPWYWIWALPLLPFVRSATWYAMSGVVMIYYARFWFQYHCESTDVLGTGYHGTTFFDFVVTWLEFAPWFLCLALGCVWNWRKTSLTVN